MHRTVYVVQQSPGKNLEPAKRYGRLKVLLHPRDVLKGADFIVGKLNERLRKINEHDFLLLIGDPIAIGLAITIALDFCEGHIFVLRWDRERYEYEPVEVTLWFRD